MTKTVYVVTMTRALASGDQHRDYRVVANNLAEALSCADERFGDDPDHKVTEIRAVGYITEVADANI